MKMVRIERKNISSVQYTRILAMDEAEQEAELRRSLLSSVYGQVFVVNAEDELLGSISLDECAQKCSMTSMRQIPCIYEDGKHGRIRDQLLKILADNPLYGFLPIVDEKKRLIAGVTCTDNKWDDDKIRALAYLNYLYEKKMDIGYFFREKGYHHVAFWGIDKVSLTFANILRKSKDITVVGIYDNQKLKETIKEDYLNYEINVNFVSSIEEIFKLNSIDLIIITDWTMRNTALVAHQDNISFAYSDQMLSSLDFRAAMNTFVFLDWKAKLGRKGIECASVSIPTEANLGIHPPKGKFMTERDKTAWLAKENGWDVDSKEVVEFINARWGFSKNIIKADGKIYFGNYRSKYINYVDKARVTLNNPSDYDNVIYLIGPCVVTCGFNQDKDTLAYYLQEYLNENFMRYKVVALGQTNDADRYYFFNMLKDEELKRGDKVFWIDQSHQGREWELDTKILFAKLYERYGKEFYYDAIAHCGREGMREVARLIFEHIKLNKNTFTDEMDVPEESKEPECFGGGVFR